MLWFNESDAIKSAGLVTAVLCATGCNVLPIEPVKQAALEVIAIKESSHIQVWLGLTERVKQMTPPEVEEALNQTSKPAMGQALFYYGLLNQRMSRRDNWVQARDAFRALNQDETLASELRILAGVLQEHNQALINWHKRHGNLQTELAHSVLERTQLQQKIKALTQLEENIRNRKELIEDDAPVAGREP